MNSLLIDRCSFILENISLKICGMQFLCTDNNFMRSARTAITFHYCYNKIRIAISISLRPYVFAVRDY